MLSNSEQITKRIFSDALEEALLIVDRNIKKWGLKIPSMADAGVYHLWDGSVAAESSNWRHGFGVGIPWLCWQYSQKERYKNYADKLIDVFCNRYFLQDQCQGVLYLPSCVNAYKITGNEKAKKAAIGAADIFLELFEKKGNYFCAYQKYRNYVVDSAFNTVLLGWASEVTGDSKYYDAAKLQLQTEIECSVRTDGSTCHQQWFDANGNPTEQTTAQGLRDDTCWSRGQAWAMLGYALHHRITQNPSYLSVFKKLAGYFFSNLNDKHISCWDLVLTGDNDDVDTSASVIAVCAVLEMASQHPDDDEIKFLKEKALLTMLSVIKNYSVSYDDYIDALLLGGVDNVNSGRSNEALIYGDYFYLEALIRLLTDFKTNWI